MSDVSTREPAMSRQVADAVREAHDAFLHVTQLASMIENGSTYSPAQVERLRGTLEGAIRKAVQAADHFITSV